MTMAIGLHLGACVLLAADTRMTAFLSEDRESYNDDHRKLQRTNMGLVTGAGLVNLLEPVKRRFAQAELNDTNDLFRMVREERSRLDTWPFLHSPRVQEALAHTAWMTTYSNFAAQPAVLRLAALAPRPPKSEYQIGLHAPGTCCLLMPVGASHAQTNAVAEHLDAEIRQISGLNELQDSIDFHLSLLSPLFEEAAETFTSCARTFQLGVHFYTPDTGMPLVGISDPFDCTGAPIGFKLEPLWSLPET